MRIAILINLDGALTHRRLVALTSTLTGDKTIFRYDIEEVEDPASFARIKSLFGTMVSTRGLNAILVCQPHTDTDPRLATPKTNVGIWLDYLATTGVDCHHRDYDPRNTECIESVLRFVDEFGVQYSKSIEEMMDSTRFLTTTEAATILSENWRQVSARDVRRLEGLAREKSGRRRLGYRECDVAQFIKDNT